MELKFCTGQNNINSNIWYENDAEKITYCSYCVNHGCVSAKYVTQLDCYAYDLSKCQCQCPKQDDHPVAKYLVCLKCQYAHFFGPGLFGQQYRSDRCQDCTKEIDPCHYGNICGSCSYTFGHCIYCCESIEVGKKTLQKLGDELPNILSYISHREDFDGKTKERNRKALLAKYDDDNKKIYYYDQSQMIIYSTIYPGHPLITDIPPPFWKRSPFKIACTTALALTASIGSVFLYQLYKTRYR